MACLFVRDDAGTFKVEAEPDCLESLLAHGVAQPGLVSGVEHQEPSSTGANQLATQGAVRHGAIVPLIDGCAAHALAALLLALPVDIHQTAELGQLAVFQGLPAAECELLYEVEVVGHFRVGPFALVVLLFQNRGCGTRVAGKEQQQVVLQVEQGLFRNGQGPRFHLTIFAEFETGDAAVGCNVLVLLADRLPQNVDLDVTGLLCQLVRVNQVLLVSMQGFQERSCEAAGRTQARPSRNVGHAGNLQIARLHAYFPEGFADYGMLDVVDGGNFLKVGVLEQETIDETRVNININVLVDGPGNQKASVLAGIGGQVRPSSAQGNPQR